MATRLKPLDLSQLQTASVRRRAYRLDVDHLAVMPDPALRLHEFFRNLPKVGRSLALLDAAELFAQTAVAARPIIWILDGVLLERGLSPLLVHLIRRGMIQCIAMNGEAALRDYEIAFHGVTAEDIAAGLEDGQLGLARETGEGINAIINEGVKRGFSIGECLGRGILDRQPKYYTHSLLATGAARLTPLTIHLSMGADGFQRYPGADGGLLGKGSLKDSFILGNLLTSIPAGTLLIAAHRSPTLNQVFLHAFALARNTNPHLGGLHLIRLGDNVPPLAELPNPGLCCDLEGPVEMMLPLLLGAVFSLIE